MIGFGISKNKILINSIIIVLIMMIDIIFIKYMQQLSYINIMIIAGIQIAATLLFIFNPVIRYLNRTNQIYRSGARIGKQLSIVNYDRQKKYQYYVHISNSFDYMATEENKEIKKSYGFLSKAIDEYFEKSEELFERIILETKIFNKFMKTVKNTQLRNEYSSLIYYLFMFFYSNVGFAFLNFGFYLGGNSHYLIDSEQFVVNNMDVLSVYDFITSGISNIITLGGIGIIPTSSISQLIFIFQIIFGVFFIATWIAIMSSVSISDDILEPVKYSKTEGIFILHDDSKELFNLFIELNEGKISDTIDFYFEESESLTKSLNSIVNDFKKPNKSEY